MRDDEQADLPTTADGTGGPAPDGVAGGDVPWLHGTWRVAEVDGTALEDGISGPPWLTFEGDGQVYGYAGVNHVRGTWRVAGGLLDVGPLAQTMMAGPPGPTATEQAVTTLLGDGGTLEHHDDEVTLRGPGGRVARLVASVEPDAPAPDPGDGPHLLT